MLRSFNTPDELPANDSGYAVASSVGAQRAAVIGIAGEPLEQLLLMLELLGWSAEVIAMPTAANNEAMRSLGDTHFRLMFIDAKLISDAGLAIDRSRTVVFLGRAPAHGRALYVGKSIIWLQLPLDVAKLERVIENAA